MCSVNLDQLLPLNTSYSIPLRKSREETLVKVMTDSLGTVFNVFSYPRQYFSLQEEHCA